ncbi:MAG: C40 family peptidase [bacterium]|nr:C40 family peptidase [bacterium]
MNNTSSTDQSQTPLDVRINAYRSDCAAAHLHGLVEAPNYVEGRLARIIAAKVSLHNGPDYDTGAVSEIIYGYDVTVYDEASGWAWVQNNRDGYVGYLPSGCLSSDMTQPTHKVTALSTFSYGAADLKTPLPHKLYMNSQLHIVEREDDYMRLRDGRFVHCQHVAELHEIADDFVSVAERYLEVPYLWGGRTCDGIDCSGLVQIAFEFSGLSCPRDSDMQQSLPGRTLDLGSMEEMQRGDLVFWPGHVAIMVDDTMLLHANARDMAVSVEPFFAAVTRIASRGDGDVLNVLRPPALSAGDLPE